MGSKGRIQVTQVLNQGNATHSPHNAPRTLVSVPVGALISVPAKILIALVRLYSYIYSSVTPATCRFSPSCSSYAVKALQVHGVFHGSYLTIRRLLRCHPWGSCGHDPVLPAR
ncbi:MAG: membrane protein insertion efficiency factor YidD [Rhodospirillales bacterium]|jgi:putative membrane protein insertion efficiency factor|nr:membrane protein insertion efficiency factor YidD [Rhodospirillales bacterium]MBT4039265.1 membrane protein insertion efficiency factor YidD [Rhodospirillales bacterium]MBT4626907.1 membrane protein insertion efficiency factor YidD [Rhodospirillales bacterium]MBT5352501.1 membrane protein insertion efficiency factor YidD [Rhodospirillales bacterium]MBT5519481.1 membrane protein insertion efficiency factor YidD [Rhodospirillales bacterium]